MMNKKIKCIIWDMDNTIWNGTLIEDDSCRLRYGIKSVLENMDSRGILQSIASTNDEEPVISRLKSCGIRKYFLHPHINWNNKVKNIHSIANKLDISLDTIGFIDDEPFELAQVNQLLPDVRTYNASEYKCLLDKPEFNHEFLTDESRRRREMYLKTEQRNLALQNTGKNRNDFMLWTKTELTLRKAAESDLDRIIELMNRTTQLNATGMIYDSWQMHHFINDPDYKVFVAQLKDRFVDYGKIGVAVCQRHQNKWRLMCFFLSCRVLSRGISGIFLNWVRCMANREGAEVFEAYFKKQMRNQKMQMLYSLNGLTFYETDSNDISIFRGTSIKRLHVPKWLKINEEHSNG